MPAATPSVTLQGRPIHMTITSPSRISEVGSTTHSTGDCQNRLMDTMATILRSIHARYLALTSLTHLAKLVDPASSTFSRPLTSMVAVDHPDERNACLGLGLEKGTQTIDASITTLVSAMSVESVASTVSTTRLMRTANTATGINDGMRALSLSFMNQTVVVVVIVAAHASHDVDESQVAATTILTTCDLTWPDCPITPAYLWNLIMESMISSRHPTTSSQTWASRKT
jgi:hypothetical protein